MCWGFQPTLFFVLVELAVLVILCLRGITNDRLNVLLHMPFFLQEVVQLGLWFVIDRDGEVNMEKCGSANVAMSMLEGGIVGFVPGWLAIWTAIGQSPALFRNLLRRRLFSWAFMCSCYVVFCLMLVAMMQSFGLCPRCTIPGPWGHQIWPFLRIQPWPMRLIHVALLFPLLDSFNICQTSNTGNLWLICSLAAASCIVLVHRG
eukprot:gnl/MRDRNA2_/MRDRNA2_79517_c0_seq1.p1 gnl/MRDRNA2_/MRDRNA2_79517_c0~~gnl/MRDRNA2_/MRDRNA2_79517_c0_seq1.p1  ORF type:complete len:204 (+),score=2.32 gnl/MRDRNA2_/MRDRNA2_79517_c0_seq1:127-738(+)